MSTSDLYDSDETPRSRRSKTSVAKQKAMEDPNMQARIQQSEAMSAMADTIATLQKQIGNLQVELARLSPFESEASKLRAEYTEWKKEQESHRNCVRDLKAIVSTILNLES